MLDVIIGRLPNTHARTYEDKRTHTPKKRKKVERVIKKMGKEKKEERGGSGK